MATANEKLAALLEILHKLQQNGSMSFKSGG